MRCEPPPPPPLCMPSPRGPRPSQRFIPTSRSPRIPRPTQILRRLPAVGWRLAPTLVEMVSGARDAFLCGEACALLRTLLEQKGALGDDASRLTPHLPALQNALVALLGRETLKAKQLAPPLQLVLQLMTLLRKAQPPAAAALAAAVAPALPPLAARHANARSAVTLVRRAIAATSPAGGGGGADAPARNGHGGSAKKAKKAKKGGGPLE